MVAGDSIVTINPELTGMWNLRYEGDCGDTSFVSENSNSYEENIPWTIIYISIKGTVKWFKDQCTFKTKSHNNNKYFALFLY